MKTYLIAGIIMVFGASCLCAQTTMRDKILKDRKEFSDRTLFQQFENEMVPTADERSQKRDKNEAKRELLLTIIDTIQMKRELKKKLQYDVYNNPFSGRLKRFMEKNTLREKIHLSN